MVPAHANPRAAVGEHGRRTSRFKAPHATVKTCAAPCQVTSRPSGQWRYKYLGSSQHWKHWGNDEWCGVVGDRWPQWAGPAGQVRLIGSCHRMAIHLPKPSPVHQGKTTPRDWTLRLIIAILSMRRHRSIPDRWAPLFLEFNVSTGPLRDGHHRVQATIQQCYDFVPSVVVVALCRGSAEATFLAASPTDDSQQELEATPDIYTSARGWPREGGLNGH